MRKLKKFQKNQNYVSWNEQSIYFLFLEEEKQKHWYEKKPLYLHACQCPGHLNTAQKCLDAREAVNWVAAFPKSVLLQCSWDVFYLPVVLKVAVLLLTLPLLAQNLMKTKYCFHSWFSSLNRILESQCWVDAKEAEHDCSARERRWGPPQDCSRQPPIWFNSHVKFTFIGRVQKRVYLKSALPMYAILLCMA